MVCRRYGWLLLAELISTELSLSCMSLVRFGTVICQGDGLPMGLGWLPAGDHGRPAAVQAVNPPSRSVAWIRPSCCRVAAARLDWYPYWQMRMICRSRRVMAGCRHWDWVATPFQGVAGHHDRAGDQPVALVVAADVHQEGAAGLGVECLGGGGAVRQHGPGLGEQFIDGHRGTVSGHGASRSGYVVPFSLVGCSCSRFARTDRC
jgi:hypothetical protein